MARRTWYRLDNIGKFYSSQAGRSSQTVFRYSADLADDIDPDILQHALDHAIAQFPSFNVHLLNGMFWHYLEQSDGRPLVEPEHLPICSRLHYGPKSMLFRVSYFRNRVNLEVSHIISDGRGAINLFKSLLHAYIAERYDVPGVPSDYDGSDSDKAENSFDKYYEKDKAGAAPGTKIYRLAGPIDRAAPTFMEYHVSASKVLGAAHQCGVSLTSYLIAAILCAIRDVMPSRARNRAIRVDIPVDLRAFFRSETVRNFYGMTYVAYTPAEIEADEDSAKTSATSPDAAGDGQQSAARTAHGNGMGGLLTDEPLADIARHVQEQLGHAHQSRARRIAYEPHDCAGKESGAASCALPCQGLGAGAGPVHRRPRDHDHRLEPWPSHLGRTTRAPCTFGELPHHTGQPEFHGLLVRRRPEHRHLHHLP